MSEVTVLGEALWDVYPATVGESLRARRREVRYPGGAPANVAITLARLGVDAAMVAAVGNDPLGEGLRDELRDAGVDVAHVVSVPARTGVTFIEVVEGEPRFLPYRSPSADMILPVEAVPQQIAWLHVGSSSFATEARAATLLAVERATAVSIDLNIYPFLFRSGLAILDEVLTRARLVKASENDLRALGLSPDRAGAAALHGRRPGALTIATFGLAGAIAFSGDATLEHRGVEVPVVDACGAGDAFTAGVLAMLARGGGVADALALGARLGARAVMTIGATAALADLAAERAALPPLR